jgi:hypothetical protein
MSTTEVAAGEETTEEGHMEVHTEDSGVTTARIEMPAGMEVADQPGIEGALVMDNPMNESSTPQHSSSSSELSTLTNAYT